MITSNNQTTDYTQEKVTENGELFDLRYPNTNEEWKFCTPGDHGHWKPVTSFPVIHESRLAARQSYRK